MPYWYGDLKDCYYGEDFVTSDRRLENFVINLIVCHDRFNLVIKFIRSNPLVLRGPKSYVCPKMPYLEGGGPKKSQC